MLWLIFSILLLIGLAALNFVPIKQINSELKQYIMGGIVVAMLLCCIIDQATIPEDKIFDIPINSRLQNYNKEGIVPLNVSTDLYWNYPARSIVKQQRILLDYLLELNNRGQASILYIKNIDRSRFKVIIKQLQKNGFANIPVVCLDFSQFAYTLTEISRSLNQNRDRITYLIPEHIQTLNHLSILQQLYTSSNYNVTILIIDPPILLMPYSSLQKYTNIYNFNNNYISQVLQNHSPRIVELCNKYRTIDYQFYLLSQTESLSELCTKLPSNQLTECIKKYLPENNVDIGVPYSKVRNCWLKSPGFSEGVIIQNGLVRLKKQFYYAGTVDYSRFIQQQNSPDGL